MNVHNIYYSFEIRNHFKNDERRGEKVAMYFQGWPRMGKICFFGFCSDRFPLLKYSRGWQWYLCATSVEIFYFEQDFQSKTRDRQARRNIEKQSSFMLLMVSQWRASPNKFSTSTLCHRGSENFLHRFDQPDRECHQFRTKDWMVMLPTSSADMRKQLSAQSHMGPQLSAAFFLRYKGKVLH